MKKRENMNNSKLKHFNPMNLRENTLLRTLRRGLILLVLFEDNDWDSRRSDFILDDEQPVKKGVDHVGIDLIVGAFQTLLLSLLMMVVFL